MAKGIFIMENKWIIWSEKYEIGYKRVDDQHRELINIINDLHSAAENGGLSIPEIKDKFKIILKRTVDYATYHFATEEKIMKAIHYKHFKEHISKHREFSSKVLEEVIKYTNGENVDMDDFIVYLRDWLFSHILGEDKAFVDELKIILEKMKAEENQIK